MRKKLILLTMTVILIAVSITAGFIYTAVQGIQQEASAARLMDTARLLLLEAEKLDPAQLGQLADTWGSQKRRIQDHLYSKRRHHPGRFRGS